MTPTRRKRVIAGVIVAAAVVSAAALLGWLTVRPTQSVDGAVTRWVDRGKPGADLAVVAVKDRNGPAIAGAVVRAWAHPDDAPVQATTDEFGNVELRLVPPRLARLTVNGHEVMSRHPWLAPSTTRGLGVTVEVRDRRLMGVRNGGGDPQEFALSEDEAAYLAEAEAQLLAGGEDWPVAWRTLSAAGEPGWALLLRHLFTLAPETDHLRAYVPYIDPTSRLGDGFYEAYTAALTERLADEQWALGWARSVLEQTRVRRLGRPWIGAYPDPMEARLDVAFARAAYEQDFGYPWNGPADEQQAALARWRAYLAEHVAPLADREDDEAFIEGNATPRWRPRRLRRDF